MRCRHPLSRWMRTATRDVAFDFRTSRRIPRVPRSHAHANASEPAWGPPR
jgi:hypothetical protein